MAKSRASVYFCQNCGYGIDQVMDGPVPGVQGMEYLCGEKGTGSAGRQPCRCRP